jgi:hypothetical protein
MNKFKQNQSNLWGNQTQVLKNSAQLQHPSQPHKINHHQPSILKKSYVLQLNYSSLLQKTILCSSIA